MSPRHHASLVVALASAGGCSTVLGLDFAGATLDFDGGAAPATSLVSCVALPCNGQCGSVPDGCAGLVQCSGCTVGEQCGARGPNRCGPGSCTARTCADIAGACGSVSDGCGNVLSCPACPVDRVPCALPWNPTLLVEDGASLQASERAEVPYREICQTEIRVCTRGILSGSFAFEGCTVTAPRSCDGPAGPVAHAATVRAFQADHVPYDAQCVSENRACDDGTLSGTFGFATCAPLPPPGFVCSTANSLAQLTCSGPPPFGPLIQHQIKCKGPSTLTDNVKGLLSGQTQVTDLAYVGGTQSFSIPCAPGGAAEWTLTCAPTGTVIHCTIAALSFDLPQP